MCEKLNNVIKRLYTLRIKESIEVYYHKDRNSIVYKEYLVLRERTDIALSKILRKVKKSMLDEDSAYIYSIYKNEVSRRKKGIR